MKRTKGKKWKRGKKKKLQQKVVEKKIEKLGIRRQAKKLMV